MCFGLFFQVVWQSSQMMQPESTNRCPHPTLTSSQYSREAQSLVSAAEEELSLLVLFKIRFEFSWGNYLELIRIP